MRAEIVLRNDDGVPTAPQVFTGLTAVQFVNRNTTTAVPLTVHVGILYVNPDAVVYVRTYDEPGKAGPA